jgi:hypothetical protein
MKSVANITAGFLFCWLATIECMCTPPINVTNRFEPFSPTLFVNKPPPPSSCAGLSTGLHNITIRGYSVVELWCQSNKAFLVLPPRTSNNTNYSEYDGVRSFVCAVRLDPATLLVDVTDLTFVAPIQQIPVGFANAGECRATWRRSTFNVDLHGTVFQLANDTIIFAYGHQFGNESWISETFKVANGSVAAVRASTLARNTLSKTFSRRPLLLAWKTSSFATTCNGACNWRWMCQMSRALLSRHRAHCQPILRARCDAMSRCETRRHLSYPLSARHCLRQHIGQRRCK